jgi:hypothetical protein
MRRPLIAAATVTVAAVAVATMAGAASAYADSTPVTFTVNGAGISITQPTATASLGTATSSLAGTSVTGSLGSTTVTDLRGSLAGWTGTITGPASGFSDGATPTPDIVADSAATVWVPATSVTVGPLATSAVRTDLHLLQASGIALSSSAQTLVTATTLGSNTVTYNPSISITLTSTVVAGTYTGTITQTVS